ncbi:SatD family protein [Sediminicola sp. 1XM1-17]|uniref:SatD family protein n=1 Tax=Sediminicola sp. 1XM1-17 TaxID=3127702 RepID=UPI0030771D54
MVAIITGDIINSDRYEVSEWMAGLKTYLSTLGNTPKDWDIYRGDEFQLKVDPSKALKVAVEIKSMIKQFKGLDVRMAIGIGEESYSGEGISESNGSAYQFSGRTFENLKQQKLNLAIATSDKDTDATLNLIFRLALEFMDSWSIVSAEIVALALQRPECSQQELADMLQIKQSAVSQRMKRAKAELVFEVLNFYENTIKEDSL